MVQVEHLLLNAQNVNSETLCPDEDLILSVTGIADVANKSFEYRRGALLLIPPVVLHLWCLIHLEQPVIAFMSMTCLF